MTPAILLARIVRLREALEDGELELALDLVCDLEYDLKQEIVAREAS